LEIISIKIVAHTATTMLAPHANLLSTQDQSVTVRPATNPSDATISAITSGGTGVSVVIAIAARRSLPVSPVSG
jgi:hypothetical protein